MADTLTPRHWDLFSRQPAGEVSHRLYVTQFIRVARGRDFRVASLHLIVIVGNPKTGRRTTFLIASLFILILIILTILLREHRTPSTPPNEPTLHPSTFVESSSIN